MLLLKRNCVTLRLAFLFEAFLGGVRWSGHSSSHGHDVSGEGAADGNGVRGVHGVQVGKRRGNNPW